jgi:hypothetical protein
MSFDWESVFSEAELLPIRELDHLVSVFVQTCFVFSLMVDWHLQGGRYFADSSLRTRIDRKDTWRGFSGEFLTPCTCSAITPEG